ncbi:MAG: NADH-quinone oxidoreductase subunit K [Candidatus Omnitrophica bacterium]|nr:NADH-quinone oxidoreductase subunit K [Candidatus Omnitrophota bacterium]
MIYFLCMVLFAIGLYGVLRKRNLIKIIIGLIIIEYATHLLFILVGYRKGGRSPILAPDQEILKIVDPLPQALILTAIVIGLAVTALIVAIAMRVYDRYGTFDITKIRRLKG